MINLYIPQVFAQSYEELLRRATESRLVPLLGQLFQSFDATMHIPTRLQNSLLANIHNDFGQEMELFLAEIFMQFAPNTTGTGKQFQHLREPKRDLPSRLTTLRKYTIFSQQTVTSKQTLSCFRIPLPLTSSPSVRMAHRTPSLVLNMRHRITQQS